MVRTWLVILGVLATAAPVAAGGNGFKAQVVGGTVSSLAAKTDVRLDLTGSGELALRGGKAELLVPYLKVNTLEYGQNVSRRYAEAILISPFFILSKTRKHYVTLGYVDAFGAQQVVVFRVNKGEVRAILAGLEARTGRRVEYQDEEARKAGR
ncbi:MAG: hypothetical protein LAQ30_23785 [Acidobacteriia bacterium]|nr:hypothetical protein [Terriglobia bacterium]